MSNPFYASIDDFYRANPERRRSGEADYGVHWRVAGCDNLRWRVSYVHATGEVYATPANEQGAVTVLGVVPPDPMSDPRRDGEIYYRTLDEVLDGCGWAVPDVSGHDLQWVEDRLTAAGYSESSNAEPDEDDLSPEIVYDLMGLAANDVAPLAVVRTWTPEQLRAAAVWASAEHLSASDNPVQRVERPAFTVVQEAL
jgi:hypothetical protein